MIVSQTTDSFPRVAELIARGGVIGFRTDTFYGLGADPFNRSAVMKIKELKGREEGKPILVLISDRDHVDRFIVERSESFDLLAERFWPGPLTLIGKANNRLPTEITAGTGTIGVRLPDDDKVRALVRVCGGGLTATSANPSAAADAKTAQELEAYFGSSIELILDGGQVLTDRPSTIVDARGPEAHLVREGLIAWSDLM